MLLFSSVPHAARAWTWFPEGRTTPVPRADPREPSLGFDAVEDSRWSARVGTAVVIGRAGEIGADGGGGIEAGLDGFAWLWFSALPGFNFPLETVDGSFGFWAGARHGRFAWRTRLSHWSGHLGDGGSDVDERRIVYSRESLAFLASYDAWPHARIYAGPAAFVRADPPTQAFQFQAGGELRPDIRKPKPGRHTDPYLAVDLRMKAENAYRVNQTYQAGLRLTDGDGRRALRLHLGYTDGYSERGQVYDQPESYVSIGMTFGD